MTRKNTYAIREIKVSLKNEQKLLREKVIALEQIRRAKIMCCIASFLVVFVCLFLVSTFTQHELYFSLLCGACFGAGASGSLYYLIGDTIPKRKDINTLRKLYKERNLNVLFLTKQGRRYFPKTYERYLDFKENIAS